MNSSEPKSYVPQFSLRMLLALVVIVAAIGSLALAVSPRSSHVLAKAWIVAAIALPLVGVVRSRGGPFATAIGALLAAGCFCAWFVFQTQPAIKPGDKLILAWLVQAEFAGALAAAAAYGLPRGRFWSVAALAIVVRVAIMASAVKYARDTPRWLEPDSQSYRQPAVSLYLAGRFETGRKPEIMRTPGYPVFLSLAIPFDDGTATPIKVQILMGGMVTLLVYGVATQIFGARAGFWAAMVYALEPLSALYTCKILSETLFSLQLMLAAYGLVRWWPNASRFWLLTATLAMTAAVLTRPAGYGLPTVTVLGVLLLARWSRTPVGGRRLLHLALFWVLAMGMVGMWQLRNYLRAGTWRLSSISTINLYQWHAAAVEARVQGKPFEIVQQQFLAEPPQIDQAVPQGEDVEAQPPAGIGQAAPQGAEVEARPREGAVLAAYSKAAWKTLRAHPATFALVYAQGVLHTALDSGSGAVIGFYQWDSDDRPRPAAFFDHLVDAARHRPGRLAIHAITMASVLVFWPLVAAGLWPRKSDAPGGVVPGWWVWVFVLWAACLIAIAGGPVGYHRMRLPAVPLLAIAAGRGIERLVTKRRRN